MEESPVGVRERLQASLQIRAPLTFRSVQDLEELQDGLPHVLRRNILQVVVELVLAEDSGILGVQAEHQAHAKDVQRMLRRVIVGFDVLLLQRIIDTADDLAGIHRNLLLPLDVQPVRVGDEGKPGVLVRQVLQQHDLRSVERMPHVVDLERLEVAGHDPEGVFVRKHPLVVTTGLLVRCEHVTAGLQVLLREVLAYTLLLDEHAGLRNERVDEPGGRLHLHRLLELDEGVWIRYPEHVLEQIQPKLAVVLFLPPLPFPLLGEALRGFLL